MYISELHDLYAKHPKVGELNLVCQAGGSNKVHLRNTIGSSFSLIAEAICQKQKGFHLFVLPDKEEAAYVLNDLEGITGNSGDDRNPNFKLSFFPRSAKSAYEIEQTDNANVAQRAEILHELKQSMHAQSKDIVHCVITYPEAIAEKIITEGTLNAVTFELNTGQHIELEFVDEWMHTYGFEKVDYVYEPGQYAVRGGIIDIFSFSFEYPYRIELFGDEVDSIRKFDPQTQLSVAMMTRATIVPNITTQSSEESRITLIDFMPSETLLWVKDAQGFLEKCQEELEKAERLFEKLGTTIQRSAPAELFVSKYDLLRSLESRSVVEFGPQRKFTEGRVITFEMEPQPAFRKNFEMLQQNLLSFYKLGYSNTISAGQPKQIERLFQIFEDKKLDPCFTPITLEFSEGFIDRDLKLLVYTDHQIFERYHRFKLKEGFKKNKEALTIKEIISLQPGDYVVHIDHGVGQFSGLQKIDVNGKEQEAIRLTYKGGDILYVSIHSLHRISKFTGKEGTAPSVDKLGSNAWQTVKRKTKAKVKEIAFDLIRLYAKRKATKGYAFQHDSYLQNELEASFMYEDTPDQLKATQAVKHDMEQDAPMDRLVCGDVGFGKTEIAIRAAFKAATDGKQVAVLVPTTILSLQHYRTFRDRLRDFPVTVDYINRFKSSKQQTETLKKLEKGEIDIVIGTHGLVGSKVKFKDLGLLIIDEEQKFGVAVKDKLKTLRAHIDTLTLTATPIPRTLQFSMMGARDLSIIQTAPPNRHPIQTELRPFGEEVIRDAISYEVQRGGQVFFVHNRIQNLREIAGMIQRLCPDVRVGIAHGQISGTEMEDIMERFIEGYFDVLVSTAIVESGIDISNANTIIINDAHHFGMSDLHQLRGRVGRNNKQAFCYLLSPPLHQLTDDARKRLQAIEQFSDLGSGMHIAMRDLDIRGAGNLLGGEQSGFINDIGFETYQKILNEAIDELKQEHFKDLYEEELKRSENYLRETALETDFEILIPDEYISSITERIQLYKELDDIQTPAGLDEFRERLKDRFGEIPSPTEALINTMQLRWLARESGMEKLVLKSGKMIGYFISSSDSPFYSSEKFSAILEFIKLNPNAGKMYEKDGSLRISFDKVNDLQRALQLLNALKSGQRLG